MLLLLEIALTIVCWRRGWKAWALAPIGTAFFLGIVIGVLAGPESTFGDVFGACLLADTACIVSLIVMAAVGCPERSMSSRYSSDFGASIVKGYVTEVAGTNKVGPLPPSA